MSDKKSDSNPKEPAQSVSMPMDSLCTLWALRIYGDRTDRDGQLICQLSRALSDVNHRLFEIEEQAEKSLEAAEEIAKKSDEMEARANFVAEERDAAIEDLRRSKQALKEWRERCNDLQDEAEEARKALAELKKASRLAWLGWINKESDFAARMLRMKEQCESKGEGQ